MHFASVDEALLSERVCFDDLADEERMVANFMPLDHPTVHVPGCAFQQRRPGLALSPDETGELVCVPPGLGAEQSRNVRLLLAKEVDGVSTAADDRLMGVLRTADGNGDQRGIPRHLGDPTAQETRRSAVCAGGNHVQPDRKERKGVDEGSFSRSALLRTATRRLSSWADESRFRRGRWYPHGESNLDLGLRRALLYPLSYGGVGRRRGKWYARRDSNARPLAPEANALSS